MTTEKFSYPLSQSMEKYFCKIIPIFPIDIIIVFAKWTLNCRYTATDHLISSSLFYNILFLK